MSEVLNAYETRVVEEYDRVAAVVDEMRETVRAGVRTCAEYGAVLSEAVTQPSGPGRDGLWTWLKGLREDVREDVIRIALKSYKTVMKLGPNLPSAAQLTFALVDDATGGSGRPAGVSREHDFFGEFVRVSSRAVIMLREYSEQRPGGDWSEAEKMEVRESLRELLEIARGCGVEV